MKIGTLPIGARVRDSLCDSLLLVAAHDHPRYPGVTLISDEPVADCCYDSAEPKNTYADRNEYGSNEYPLSNIHQWLNATTEVWFRPASATDCPPANFIDPMMPPEFLQNMPPCVTPAEPGFLFRFSGYFRDSLSEVPVSYVHTEANGSRNVLTVFAAVHLPSQTELGLDIDVEFPEGQCLKLMQDPRMKLCRRGYWTRTPAFRDSDDIVLPYHMRIDEPSSAARVMEGMLYKFYGNKHCCSVSGVRPLIHLSGNTLVSGPDASGIYIIQPE